MYYNEYILNQEGLKMLEITKEFVLSKVDIDDITDIDRYVELCKELQEFLDSDDFIDDVYSDLDYMHMQGIADYEKIMCEDNIVFSMNSFCSYCDERYDAFEIIERCNHDLFDKHDALFIDTNYGEVLTGNGLNDFDINMNDIVVRIIEDPIPFVWEYSQHFEYNNVKISEIKEKMKECVKNR